MQTQDMTLTMGTGGLPVGSYAVEFSGAEPFEDNSEKYGPALLLRFRVLSGDFAGQDATRICSRKLTPKSALGKLATSIKGGKIEAGEQFSFGDHIGTRGKVVVNETDSGGTRVEVFLRDAD